MRRVSLYTILMLCSILLPMFSIRLETVTASAVYGLPEMSSDGRSFGTSMAIGSVADGAGGYARIAVDSN